MQIISIYHGETEKNGVKRDWYVLKLNGVSLTFDVAKIIQAVGIDTLARLPIGSEIEL